MKRFARKVTAILISLVIFSPQGDALVIKSEAFEDGGEVPVKYTGLGEDVSPSLSWSDPPEKANSFVLIMDDPDAPMGTWVHWVLYNIPKEVASLAENVPKLSILASGAMQGMNSFKKTGYNGPYPPAGAAHRYYFTLYAVDYVPSIPPGAGKDDILNAIKGHVIEKASIMGRYGRE